MVEVGLIPAEDAARAVVVMLKGTGSGTGTVAVEAEVDMDSEVVAEREEVIFVYLFLSLFLVPALLQVRIIFILLGEEGEVCTVPELTDRYR